MFLAVNRNMSVPFSAPYLYLKIKSLIFKVLSMLLITEVLAL